ncbi:MAG: hypothetical protein CR988_03075 [Treponema sp.]|nr:MAG: hypothetical protein CR988_03075 [Treponema sp.]
MSKRNHNKHSKRKFFQKKNQEEKKIISKTNDLPVYICPKCQAPITEISSALCDKTTGKPIHFDCVIEILKATEELAENTEITYIGNGQFAVMEFEDPYNRKKFKILKTIKWEENPESIEWRQEITKLYQSY